ncbi:MAG: cell envelope biogenesis protein OmpA, partial [Elusimicrobia bacterium]|nr:cell envelope biogenesis protein OmpA [Elusimicrobiota bacterium]
MRSWLAVAAAALAAGACAPKPVLYPNAHYKEVGKDRSQADMKECEALADQYVKNRAAANAAASTGKGAAIGAAGGAAAGAVFGGLGRGAAA